MDAPREANGWSLHGRPAEMGDVDASIDAWLADMRLRLIRLARQFLANAADAEEVTQEALALAWQRRASLRDAGRRNAWLYRVTINLCQNARRKRRPTRELGEAASPAQATGSVQLTELADRVRAVLAELPETQQAAFVLREIEGLAYEDVAAILDTRAGGVRVLVHRARESVRRMLLARWPDSFA